jgi:hypothetical protein
MFFKEKAKARFVRDAILEGEFSARKQANGNIALVHRGKAASEGVGERCRYELVADFCRA